MDVAIGLPNAVPNTSGAELTEWARRAEAREFSSLGTIDRIVYPNYEPIVALSAAAAVTERIGLCTAVLLGPLRVNAAILAKQALSLNALSGGRFTLGIALGGREDDYEISHIGMEGRGAWLDQALGEVKEIWAGEEVGPATAGAPGLVVGGYVDASATRAARFADGWIAGGGGRSHSK
jgi:alkanesulfonate monooxygenase SsuD/methylene tetrahydromethanopterin reductase-like flavin-dependent oxidoreductase (luciferase family)